MLINGPFGGDDKPLKALEQAGMVAVLHRDGMWPSKIESSRAMTDCLPRASVGQTSTLRPGRPVWRAAFRRLTDDRVFSAMQELQLISKTKSSSSAAIKSASDELISLGPLFNEHGAWIFTGSSHVPVAMSARVDGLLKTMQENQEKLAEASKLEESLKVVLKGGSDATKRK